MSIYDRIDLSQLKFNLPELNRTVEMPPLNIPTMNPNLGILNVPVSGGALEPTVFNYQAPPQVSAPEPVSVKPKLTVGDNAMTREPSDVFIPPPVEERSEETQRLTEQGAPETVVEDVEDDVALTMPSAPEPEPEPTTAPVMPSAPGSEGTGIASVGPRGTEIVSTVAPPSYSTRQTPFQEQAIAPQTTLMDTAQSGLGGFFTPAQVEQIVNPLPIPTNTYNSSDMNRLLQLQRDAYRGFLTQPSDGQTTVQEPVYDSTNYQNIAGSGIMGTAYNPGTSFDFEAGFGFSPFFPRPRDEVDPYANIYRLYDPLRFSRQRVYDLGPVFNDTDYAGMTGLTSLVDNDIMKIAANEQEARRPPMMF
jgi:hypothetical protein